jgi:hypothetical protein
MPLEYISAFIITVVCLRIFGHFECHAALPPRILKWSIYLAIVVLLTVTVGRPWSLIWTFGIMGLAIGIHSAWCIAHGLNPFTAVPRDKYLAIRGWTHLESKRD